MATSFHSTGESAIIGLVRAVTPPTPSYIPPQGNEPTTMLAQFFTYAAMLIIIIFVAIFVLVAAVMVGTFVGFVANFLLSLVGHAKH